MKHYGIEEDTILERTTDHGVEIDGLLVKDGGFSLGSDSDGDMYYRLDGKLVRLPKGLPFQVPQMKADGIGIEWTYSLPAGTIIAWPTGIVPIGFLECDGASINRLTYGSLFNILSTNYGAVDGSHFNLPDYRGVFMRGWAHGSINDPDRATRTNRGDGTNGDQVGTKQASETKAHSHTASSSTTVHADGNHYHGLRTGAGDGPDIYGWNSSLNANQHTINSDYSGSHAHGAVTSTTVNNSIGNESRPININVMFCIKY